jgi:hypothetical protein
MIGVELPDEWKRWRMYRADDMRRGGLTGEWAGLHAHLEAKCRAAIEDAFGSIMARRVSLEFAFDPDARALRCVAGEGTPPDVAAIVARIGGGAAS